MPRYFCDICGKELDHKPDENVCINTRNVCITSLDDNAILLKMEICPECANNIINFIKNVRIKCDNTYKKSKREIGDKVRCLITNSQIGLYAGRVYTVCDIPKDYDDAVYVDVGNGWQSLLRFGQFSYRLE